MNFSLILSCLGFVQAQSLPKINHLYALGDSITDTGLLYNLTQGKVPAAALGYWEGRFSDGRTWVEYLSSKFDASLTSYALGGATTDNVALPDAYSLGIPGCLQQAEQLINNGYPVDFERSLVTIAFLGNDFFYPHATAEMYIENISKCIGKVAGSGKAKHILIPTSFKPEIMPYFIKSPQEGAVVKEKTSQVMKLWPETLKSLRGEFPDVVFYDFNLKGVMEGIHERGLEYCHTAHLTFKSTAPCLNFLPFAPPEAPEICPTSNRMFHDPLHFSTRVHEAIAMRAFQDLAGVKRGKDGIPHKCIESIHHKTIQISPFDPYRPPRLPKK